MSKSVMLLSSGPRRMRPQLKRLQAKLADDGLGLEGPFSDKDGNLERLIGDIRKGLRTTPASDPVIAVMIALSPQNQDYAIQSWLDVPFVLGDAALDIDSGNAGALAGSRGMTTTGKEVRVMDIESLTLIAISLLRRLGVPALFSYHHVDPMNPEILEAAEVKFDRGESVALAPVPGLFAMSDDGAEVLAFTVPELYSFPQGNMIKAVEILSDEALQSLLSIKSAARQADSLMWSIANKERHFNGERLARAIAVGHALHEGISGWTEEEAKESITDAESFVGRWNNDISSVRRFYQKTMASDLICPARHALMAASALLNGNDMKVLMDMISAATRNDEELFLRIVKAAPQSERASHLAEYMELAKVMRSHIHPDEECQGTGQGSRN